VLWARSRAMEFYLGRTLVGCRTPTDDASDRWIDVANLDEGLSRLGECMSASPLPVRGRVWLGSTLARPFVVPADGGARNSGEAHELAEAIAGDLTGLDGDLKVWLAPWQGGRATLAAASPQYVLSALAKAAAARRGQRVASVRPWWNQVFDAVHDRSRAQVRSIGWTLAEPDGLVQGRAASGDVVEATFEARTTHDPDATLARRRLAIGWSEVDEIEHFEFADETAAQSPLFAIGGARLLRADETEA